MEKQARQGPFWGWDAVRSKRGITQGEQARAEIQIAEKKGEVSRKKQQHRASPQTRRYTMSVLLKLVGHQTGTNRESVDTVRREKDQV
jgi:hypothetical protein